MAQPLDADAVRAAARTGLIVTVEDHGVWGGLGSRIVELCNGEPVTVRKMGVRGFQTSGPVADLWRNAGLAPEHIAETVRAALRAGGAARPTAPTAPEAAAR